MFISISTGYFSITAQLPHASEIDILFITRYLCLMIPQESLLDIHGCEASLTVQKTADAYTSAMEKHFFLPSIVLTSMLCGCASSPLDNEQTYTISSSRELMKAPLAPTVETYPIQQIPQAAAKSIPSNEEPLPIWENSQIQKVLVDAYIDEKGNLHPESYMYVVVKPGGWNLDAVRKPNNYIPPENAVKPMEGFGISYGLSSSLPKSQASESSSIAIAGGDNIRITGLISKSDGNTARKMSDPQREVVIYDPKLGWIIAPKQIMSESRSAPKAYKSIPQRDQMADEFGKIGSESTSNIPEYDSF